MNPDKSNLLNIPDYFILITISKAKVTLTSLS